MGSQGELALLGWFLTLTHWTLTAGHGYWQKEAQHCYLLVHLTEAQFNFPLLPSLFPPTPPLSFSPSTQAHKPSLTPTLKQYDSLHLSLLSSASLPRDTPYHNA